MRASSATVLTFEVGPYTYRASPFTATAQVTGVGGLDTTVPVVYTGDCTNVTSANGCTGTATFAGDTNHDGGSDSDSITLTTKAASVNAVDKSKTYGDDNPALTATVDGTIGSETLHYTLTTTAVKFSNVSAYPIAVTLGSNPNYDVSKSDASLSITPKGASVTANGKTKVYGTENPALDASVTGTVNGNTLDYTLATTATRASGVGSYPIDVTLGTNPNYTINVTASALMVTPKQLTIIANSTTKILGATHSFAGTEFTSTGLVSGDTIASVTLSSTGAPEVATIGSYPIVPSAAVGAAVGNYSITYTNGTLKVLYLWNGFLQPINDTAHDAHTTALYSSFKAGQTIPVKFELRNASGQIITQTENPVFNRTARMGACSVVGDLEEAVYPVAPDSDGLFKLTGSQYNYGWSTKGLVPGLYQIYANLADGTTRSVYICLTK
ncbi:MAG: MBG-2 domain-containing protein [Acidobacteria bacterium]|nr:MBG-2 domain-containing protein [Acidobacteriota bacterium]